MKIWFDELDRWMIQHWAAAHELEESMIRVREKYESIFEAVTERVQDEFPELDRTKTHLTSYGGCVGFSKKSWHSDMASWPTGFWISEIGFESLTSEVGEPLNASIWISQRSRAASDNLLKIKQVVAKKAVKLIQDKGIKLKTYDPEDARTIGWYELKKTRQEIVNMLLDHDGEKFVSYMAQHVSRLARFIPILDEVLTNPTTKS